MQFLKISNDCKLSTLSERVGSRNVDSILGLNNVSRTPYIGKAFTDKCNHTVATSQDVNWQRKATVLNSFTQDSDVFEYAALLNNNGWKVLSNMNTFPGYLKLPESVKLPDSTDILGDGSGVSKTVYKGVMSDLEQDPHIIDPARFNSYSTMKPSIISDSLSSGTNPIQWFNLPWDNVTLYSSLAGESVNFPTYPEEYEDETHANYTQMPDMIMQYEPWMLYQSSGPRTNTYKFHMHRDMWSGDHTDGQANKLIRFCEANCYPEYNGSAVNTATVTLYISGKALITGVMTDVSTEWGGPIGQDGWYLEVTLSLTITEVSKTPLNFETVRAKPLIG